MGYALDEHTGETMRRPRQRQTMHPLGDRSMQTFKPTIMILSCANAFRFSCVPQWQVHNHAAGTGARMQIYERARAFVALRRCLARRERPQCVHKHNHHFLLSRWRCRSDDKQVKCGTCVFDCIVVGVTVKCAHVNCADRFSKRVCALITA